jgi:hypothetical protein
MHPIVMYALLASGRGGRAALWVGGWLVLLAAIVLVVLRVTRRRNSHNDDKDRRWP